MCVFTEFNVMAKAHVCFRHDPSQGLLHNTPVPKLSPNLTLTMPTRITLPAPLLTYHCIAPTLRTQIPRHIYIPGSNIQRRGTSISKPIVLIALAIAGRLHTCL